MTKQTISSKLVRARSLAIYELDKFIEIILTIDPELKHDEATLMAAMSLRHLWENIQSDCELHNILKQAATEIKSSR